MKTKLFLLFTSIIYLNTYAQFGPQQIITTGDDNAWSVYATDIDGDGDMDVLWINNWGMDGPSKIVYHENDGNGNFGPQRIISMSANWPVSIYPTEIDGDGKMDFFLAYSGKFNSGIGWYEQDNQGGFGQLQLITSINVQFTQISVYADDLDGDGDMDLLSASDWENQIAWYENDGDGNFGPQQIITTNADFAQSVYATDLDGDGDMDVLSASWSDNKIAWYENDGDGNFGPQQIITTNADAAKSVYAADIDGDGDMDVLSASRSDNKIAWYENDGDGNFGPQQIITTIASGANSVYATDIDVDGDMDVLSASYFDDKIAWYENDGDGNFGPQQIITTNADGVRSVDAADLDGDGDMDVLSASYVDDKIAWYENFTILGLAEQNESTLLIYPNPSKELIFIRLQNEVITKIELYNLLGQKIQTFVNNVENINIANLQAGIYLLKIHAENRTITKKIIKM